MNERKRFQEFTEEEISAKRKKVQKKNTIKSDKSTGNQLQAYLKQISEPVEFWDYTLDKLNAILGKFWFSARQVKSDQDGNDKKYTVQSLRSIRYGINRVLKEK